ncbi:type I secretion system permease/ATPase [Marinomonas transparens]|uniref:Type I secretion system permease/ATPase n=1 Tax=Marinomonas transparens TaxID=2795388 RepID=A0A934JQ95_9GAMM|nr:type I secretion system permease/ATPase [Marinomonas transparens]MBJ7539956.1 type I secretion system permease/ATPase [Marinomonas transparens]
MSNRHSPEQSLFAQVLSSLKSSAAYLGLLSFFINLLMLTGPLFMIQVYDRVLASSSIPTLMVIGGFALCMYVFFGILEGMRSRILARIGLWMDAKLSGLSFEASTKAPILLGSKSEKLRPVQDMDTIRQFVCGAGPSAIMDMPWLPFYLGIVFLFHPIFGYVALGGILVICLLIATNEYFSKKPSTEFAQENIQRTIAVESARRNAEVIQAMGMMPILQWRWDQKNEGYLDKQLVTSDRSAFYSTTIKTFRFILQSLILATGAWLAINQEVSPGIMIAASIMSSRALAPIEQAVSQWRAFLSARQSLKRLKEVLDAKPSKGILDLPLPCKSLTLTNFACAPAGVRQPFVQNVSLEIMSGDGLGIIGPSGSGKSTLARGLTGILPSLKGSVRFDGAEISQWSEDRIGDFIGYLPQDVQLFDGTIAENISRFSVDAESEDIIKAAQMAGVHDLIVTFSEGYNTVISATGLSLSGGQRQRLALARALYKEPFLVVLDEPNSNLDSEGDLALTKAIKAIRAAGSIVIVIAHRPSAISAVDHLLCMKDGVPTAMGPKNEVMKQVVAPVSAKETA